MANMDHLGTRIRDARKVAGLTQEQLAAKAGITTMTLSNIERKADAKPRAETIAALARALEVDVGRLLDPATSQPAA